MKGISGKIIRSASVISAIGTVAIVGVRLYRTFTAERTRRQIEHKLDRTLENSMDCSDATATY